MAETTYELQTLLAKPFISGVTYTPGATTTYTPAFPSMGFQAVDVVYYVETSATGTTPTMTLTLMACDDQGTHEYAIGSATSTFHTAAGQQPSAFHAISSSECRHRGTLHNTVQVGS